MKARYNTHRWDKGKHLAILLAQTPWKMGERDSFVNDYHHGF